MDSQSFNGYQVPGSSPVNPSSIPYAISVRNTGFNRLTTIDVLGAAARLQNAEHFTEIGSYAAGQYIVESPIQHSISYRRMLEEIVARPFVCGLVITNASSRQQGNRPLIYDRDASDGVAGVRDPIFPSDPISGTPYFMNYYQQKFLIDGNTSLFVPVLLPGEELMFYIYPSYYPSINP